MGGQSKVTVAGVGMTDFGKFPDRGLKSLSQEAVGAALKDAALEPEDIEVAFAANSVAGLITGQECIRGQVVLRESSIGGIPIFNVENACASSSSAFHLACQLISSGAYDTALVVGFEKLTHPDKKVSLGAFSSAVDIELAKVLQEAMQKMGSRPGKDGDAKDKGASGEGGGSKSMFMDIYAAAIRMHMSEYGTTQEQIAKVCVKSHAFGALNPHAQYREELTLDEVLGARVIAYPLTLPMCAPIGDGAAAAVLVSDDYARSHAISGPQVAASVVLSGSLPSAGTPMAEVRAGAAAYEMAGIGPDDVDVAEVHDATSAAEILAYEDLGFCARGEGGRLADEGATSLGGRIPVNTSGGLSSKGHPIGASGVAQICEIAWQLRGDCGARQVEGARIGLTQNGGGFLGNDAAAQAVHILTA